MSTNLYKLEDGHVFRGDEKVASYNPENDTLDFLPGMARYRAIVIRLLRVQGVPVKAAKAVDEPTPAPEVQSDPEGAPEQDPMLGDKTPAFVDWLYANRPEEAARRYQGRKTHRS